MCCDICFVKIKCKYVLLYISTVLPQPHLSMLIMMLPEKVQICERELQFPRNSFISIIGPSGCGKTRQTVNLLEKSQKCFSEAPTHWYFLYNYWQSSYDELKRALGSEKITFIQGWHSNVVEKLGLNSRTESDPTIGLVIDDLAEQLNHDRSCLPIFTSQIHHKSKQFYGSLSPL